jgi:RNA polymerase sigma-70 factor (ECF subfamily)
VRARGPEISATLESAIAGDRHALAELLVEHGGPLTERLSNRLRLNPFADFSVEDVLQEVFLDVDRGIGTFRTDTEASFAAWLGKLADNRLAKMLRDRSRAKRGGGRRRLTTRPDSLESSIRSLVEHLAAGESSAVGEHLIREEVIRAVRDGLARLPSDQRIAVEQYYLREESLASTAATMQRSRGAVRGLLHRAKKAMRDALGESSRWFRRR